MMKFLVLFHLLLGSPLDPRAEDTPFLLANSLPPPKHSLDDCYLSEKLDGVQAYFSMEPKPIDHSII